jgi:hypothetical protein
MTDPRITLPRAPDRRLLTRYEKLISRCKAKNREISEKHHIVPKCIGGSDSEDNIVSLSPREHYLAHYILHRMYPDNKPLQRAYWMMSHTRGFKINSDGTVTTKFSHDWPEGFKLGRKPSNDIV